MWLDWSQAEVIDRVGHGENSSPPPMDGPSVGSSTDAVRCLVSLVTGPIVRAGQCATVQNGVPVIPVGWCLATRGSDVEKWEGSHRAILPRIRRVQQERREKVGGQLSL